MKVLSLFDGISCGQVALQRAGVPVSIYFASEIERAPIECTLKNYPLTVQLGDVVKVREMAEAGFFNDIDLLIGGSPCQGFSHAGMQEGFSDPRSALFFEFVRIKNAIKPRYFLLENVKMRKEWLNLITIYMNCEPVFIDSADFSAQSRKRYYWTNIPVNPWQPSGVTLKDVLQTPNYEIYTRDKPFQPKSNQAKSGCIHGSGGNAGGNHSQMDVVCLDGEKPKVNHSGKRIEIFSNEKVRRYSVTECERLQTLPEGYTASMKKTNAYKAIGNGWTVDVLAHIFRGLSTCQ